MGKGHARNEDIALRIDKFTVDADGKTHINTSLAEALVIGNGEAGIDYYIRFDGNPLDGKIIWQTDKNKFKFDCGLELTGCGFMDNMEEYTLDAGVTIEGVLLKDNDLILSGSGAVLSDGVNSVTVSEIDDAVAHKDLTNNPHVVTAEQIGYGMTYAEDDTVSTTTDTAWQQKYRMNFTPPATGNYLLEWSLEIANSKLGSSTFVQIELDDTTQINRVYREADIANEYCNYSGFKKINFADTNLHTIDVDFKAEGDTAMICRVRLSMRKI